MVDPDRILELDSRATDGHSSFEFKTSRGADIVLEIAKFERDIGFKKAPGAKVSADHYGFPDEGFAKNQHTFIFKGFMLDKAYCVVSLAADGKITEKNSFILYD